MDAFAPIPPDWTNSAVHVHEFSCPTCRTACVEAEKVWINRRSPVFTEEHRKRWQEFYLCTCGVSWWAWSSDRPPTDLKSWDISDMSWGDGGLL
ncbi:hypothetical protein H6F93_13600 [Leptolyngbya sp. FACHB-671]|uniref:hypothetical protein n=1 Tax=unclassified Leptolyngbya TaxID=2650499 RepID=UPI0016890788|nr:MULTISPECIES: hypothetical protein [unclassified Leptolyngbya]MBD1869673.1 hypothetical protein [Cyanobacteria bacterium FACHB-471]MBD1999424.1 hypothetical protein [Leptolyngbya sp. FACHB-541]MBD2068544.1 hypothetical protein [Leptolyngbya sp. FACHB-671]